jgi:Domain of unknown function (DUF397)
VAGGHAAALEWRSSSYCNGGACVQVAVCGDMIALRSSATPASPHLLVTRYAWRDLRRQIQQGKLDPGQPSD